MAEGTGMVEDSWRIADACPAKIPLAKLAGVIRDLDYVTSHDERAVRAAAAKRLRPFVPSIVAALKAMTQGVSGS